MKGTADNNSIFLDFKQGRLEPFYRSVYPGLLLYTNKLLGAQHEMLAEDFAQEVAFKAWERRDSFTSLNSLKSFLYTSARNDIISLHRKNSSHSRYVQHEVRGEAPSIEIIDNEARAILFNAIDQLPGKMRTVFTLNFMEGLKLSEVAEKMELTESSVKKYKAQGLAILRRRLDPSLFLLLAGII